MFSIFSLLRAMIDAGDWGARDDRRATELRDPAWLVRSSGWAPANAAR